MPTSEDFEPLPLQDLDGDVEMKGKEPVRARICGRGDDEAEVKQEPGVKSEEEGDEDDEPGPSVKREPRIKDEPMD